MQGLLKRLLRISPEEASFARREFHCLRESTRRRLELVGETFLQGYHLALSEREIDSVVYHLQEIEPEFRGFGFEGAAMGLDLLDQLIPGKGYRVGSLLRDAGSSHIYMVHVGVGWSMARWRMRISGRLRRLDPMLNWLALDGFGFHEGYFHWARYADGGRAPAVIHGYGQRAFDQGLGRSLWFVGGADPDYILPAMQRFPEMRRNDLWSGVGLACTYAGGAESRDVEVLRRAVGSSWTHLAQGSAFGAAARHRAGNMTDHTELNCKLLCGISAHEAAEICSSTLAKVGSDNGTPAYETWRRLIREQMMAAKVNELEYSHVESVPNVERPSTIAADGWPGESRFQRFSP